jgi:hypothetical protein
LTVLGCFTVFSTKFRDTVSKAALQLTPPGHPLLLLSFHTALGNTNVARTPHHLNFKVSKEVDNLGNKHCPPLLLRPNW